MFEALRTFLAPRTAASSRLILAGVIALAGMAPFAAPASADDGRPRPVAQQTAVTPLPVLFTDRDGTAEDSYAVPVSQGVDYLVGGSVVNAGSHPGSGTVTVTAQAKPGHVLAAGATTRWTLAFKGALEAAVPAVSGVPAVGSTLTALPGTWTPAPDSLAYQWYRSGTAIAGAASAGYRLTEADLETTITVRVTGSKSGYGTASAESAGVSVEPGPAFADVGPDTSFFREGNWMASAGISRGWAEADGARTYRPTQPVHRDQMAAFLYRLAGSPDYEPPAASPFADVSTRHAFYKEIAWLAAAGISRGWAEADDTRTFRPADAVRRDQMAAFLYRHAGSPDFVPLAQPPFTDITPDHPFYREMSWVWKTGIARGWSSGDGSQAFRPSASILRDQMAAFIYRYATRS